MLNLYKLNKHNFSRFYTYDFASVMVELNGVAFVIKLTCAKEIEL